MISTAVSRPIAGRRSNPCNSTVSFTGISPVLAKFNGYRVGEIDVRHHPRKYGHSKYGVKRFISGFLDLLTVILLTRYTSRPLHFFGTVGLTFCFIGGLVDLYIVKLWVFSGFRHIGGRQPLLLGGVFLFLPRSPVSFQPVCWLSS